MNANYASRRRNVANRRGRSKLQAFVKALQVVILLGMGAMVGVGLGLFISLSGVLPTVGDFEAPEATIIYSSDGIVLGRIFHEDRTNVPLKDIPKVMRDATVAIEDSRFYQHSGVDMRGIARALWQNLRGHRLAQGGSTITQQLARNVYLTQRKTVQRKLQEAVLAILIERNFTKNKILELYLNRVYYGSGAFGVQAASKVYYGKNVDKINLSEAALIAGLPARPSGFSPHEDKKIALARRDVVLNRLAELGYISLSERDQAKQQQIAISPINKGRNSYKAPHFIDYVAKELRERYGDDVLYGGGLRVYTTLNYKMQEIAEERLREGVRRHKKAYKVTEGCFVCIEPTNGYIRAMVGSVDPSSQFNRCTQGMGQQPGSAFKAFVYTAAFEEGGMTPSDKEANSYRSTAFPNGRGGYWRPKNYDKSWGGSVTLETAVAKSINIPAINVAKKVGIKNVIKYAELMGISSKLQPYLSTAIGASDVYPLEMASAYGTFANNGVHVESSAIIRVTNRHGDVLEDYQPEGQRIISERTNQMIDKCLRAVVTRGTGRIVSAVRNARGKTGTTNDDRDTWFIGFVPNKLVAACWVGNDDNSPTKGAYGGLVCGPVWREFMLKSIPIYDKIYADQDKAVKKAIVKEEPEKKKPSDENKQIAEENATEPDTDNESIADSEVVSVKICDDSQLRATPNCPSTHTEKLLRGTEPTSYCSTHKPREADNSDDNANKPNNSEMTVATICPDSGMLAGPNCPHPVRKRMSIDDLPTQECSVHTRAGNR